MIARTLFSVTLLLAVSSVQASSVGTGSILLRTYATMAGTVIADELVQGNGTFSAISKQVTAAYIAELLLAGNEDPWLNLTYVLENDSDFQQYFSLSLALYTLDTSGPTAADAFMDLTLTDGNGDGFAWLNGISANFQVADERGGQTTPVQSIAFSAPFTNYGSAGSYSVFDTGGPGRGRTPIPSRVAAWDSTNSGFLSADT